MQLKGHLSNPIKGIQSIAEYMQEIKTHVNTFALMNVPIEIEDHIIKILYGLDKNYKNLSDVIQVHEMSISFDETSWKLINYEAHLLPRTMLLHTYPAFVVTHSSTLPCRAPKQYGLHGQISDPHANPLSESWVSKQQNHRKN